MIFYHKLAQDVPAKGRCFLPGAVIKHFTKIGRKPATGLNGQPGNGLDNKGS